MLVGSVVPLNCPGCGLDDVPWCEECAALWWEDPFRSDGWAPRLDLFGRKPLPVWSIASLSGPAHLMIRAWKDGRRRDLDAFFSEAMHRAAASLAQVLADAGSVVPVPPHPHSIRSRGVDLTAMLARSAAQGLSTANRTVPVELPLRNRGGESRSMAAGERWLNAIRGLHLHCGAKRFDAAVLVDDVVTTGASLARAASLLEGAGVAVLGSLTLAAAPRRDLGPIG